jgi:hypothetical protein
LVVSLLQLRLGSWGEHEKQLMMSWAQEQASVRQLVLLDENWNRGPRVYIECHGSSFIRASLIRPSDAACKLMAAPVDVKVFCFWLSVDACGCEVVRSSLLVRLRAVRLHVQRIARFTRPWPRPLSCLVISRRMFWIFSTSTSRSRPESGSLILVFPEVGLLRPIMTLVRHWAPPPESK